MHGRNGVSGYGLRNSGHVRNFLARLGIPGKHSLLTQRETFDGLYEGILDRICSHDFEQFHGAVVRFRELCRYKSSALVKELVRKLFETEAVRHALSISLEPEAYDESFAETALLQDAKLNVAACFRHLSVDPAFARMLTTDKSFLDLLGRCLNQESVDSIRHTVGFSFENRLCQTIVTCAYPPHSPAHSGLCPTNYFNYFICNVEWLQFPCSRAAEGGKSRESRGKRARRAALCRRVKDFEPR